MRLLPRLLIVCCALGQILRAAAAESALPDIDFSYAGFGGGGVALPHVVAVTRLVRSPSGDDTARLQAALDWAARQPIRADGFRGAVILEPGTYRVGGTLHLRASGVVLRGSADSANPTLIVATGTDRRTLLQLGQPSAVPTGNTVRINDDLVPAGAMTVTVTNAAEFHVGDQVVVQRPSTPAWIAALEMNRAPGNFADQRVHWLPGSRDLVWDRTIAAVDTEKGRLTFDAPLTTALETRFGGGTVRKVVTRVADHIAVEHLVLESEFATDHPLDEEHAWIAVALDHVADAWVRDITAVHFAGSAVRVGPRARRVTVEDCQSLAPVSEMGGYRRQSFLVEGQQTLVQRCQSENGCIDFGVALCAAGPNVFLECVAAGARGASGAFESWASGVLYERVRIDGAGLRLTYDMERTQGAGWTAANSVISNCTATTIEARGPAGAANVVREADTSLYASQLERRGRKLPGKAPEPPEAVVAEFRAPPEEAPAANVVPPALEIVGGRFVIGGSVVWGGQFNAGWWKGQTSAAIAAQAAGRSITRFAPGRIGAGLTEDLDQLASDMASRGLPFYAGGPGLWYDRRRDDHLLIPRADGNVWAPFFELPWARSGEGKAWDGLSKYDLSRYNPWFFSRTRDFAAIAAQRGLVVYHSLYNTHNILETFAHYTDYPWRAANCINDIGLTEPPPMDAGNTIHLNNLVYNVDHPGRRALHRAYIRHTLDELGGSPNVIFSLAFQFAGPLAFQQFFLDTVAEWERETHRHVRIALITSKDITDAILADPQRSRQIAIIDLRYWQEQTDGTLWAPRGDVNRAFREQNGTLFGRAVDSPPNTTPAKVYRGVREYRDRFPDKAIVAWHGGAGAIPVLMAGGAQALITNPAAGQSQGLTGATAAVDAFVRDAVGNVLMKLIPRDGWLQDPESNWCLADEGDNLLVYSASGGEIAWQRPPPRDSYGSGVWFDPQSGKTVRSETIRLGAGSRITKPSAGPWLLFLTAKGQRG